MIKSCKERKINKILVITFVVSILFIIFSINLVNAPNLVPKVSKYQFGIADIGVIQKTSVGTMGYLASSEAEANKIINELRDAGFGGTKLPTRANGQVEVVIDDINKVMEPSAEKFTLDNGHDVEAVKIDNNAITSYKDLSEEDATSLINSLDLRFFKYIKFRHFNAQNVPIYDVHVFNRPINELPYKGPLKQPVPNINPSSSEVNQIKPLQKAEPTLVKKLNLVVPADISVGSINDLKASRKSLTYLDNWKEWRESYLKTFNDILQKTGKMPGHDYFVMPVLNRDIKIYRGTTLKDLKGKDGLQLVPVNPERPALYFSVDPLVATHYADKTGGPDIVVTEVSMSTIKQMYLSGEIVVDAPVGYTSDPTEIVVWPKSGSSVFLKPDKIYFKDEILQPDPDSLWKRIYRELSP